MFTVANVIFKSKDFKIMEQNIHSEFVLVNGKLKFL